MYIDSGKRKVLSIGNNGLLMRASADHSQKKISLIK